MQNAFKYLSEKQLSRFEPKREMLEDINCKQIIWFTDYNDTIAPKGNMRGFGSATLTAGRYEFLRALGTQIKNIGVISAQGGIMRNYLSAPCYVSRYGYIPNLWVGTNSGHLLWKDIYDPATEPVLLPVPDYKNTPGLQDLVVKGIYKIGRDLRDEYNGCGGWGVRLEEHELCSTIRFSFDGENNSTVQKFLMHAEGLKSDLDEPVASHITFSTREFQVDLPDGRKQWQGYIDVKQQRMNKGYTAEKILLDHLSKTDGFAIEDAIVIVSGDSYRADLPMMEKLNYLAEKGKIIDAICIGVGGRLSQKVGNENSNVHLMLNPGSQDMAIGQFYRVLADIVGTCKKPVRQNDFKARVPVAPLLK